MFNYLKNLFFLFFVFFFTESMSLESDWSISSESQVRLISPLTKNNDLNDLYIGLEYKLNKDWKTYWKSPGEGGFPQEVDWSNSKNVKSLEIKWPIPEYYQILDINSIGYKDNIIISASNAGALSIKNGNEKNKILGPLGTILNSVDLNSLITNH